MLPVVQRGKYYTVTYIYINIQYLSLYQKLRRNTSKHGAGKESDERLPMMVYQASHLALCVPQIGYKVLQAPRLRCHFNCLLVWINERVGCVLQFAWLSLEPIVHFIACCWGTEVRKNCPFMHAEGILRSLYGTVDVGLLWMLIV